MFYYVIHLLIDYTRNTSSFNHSLFTVPIGLHSSRDLYGRFSIHHLSQYLMHISGTSALYIYLFVVISWLEYCQNEYPRWIPLQYKWSIDRAGLYSSLRLAFWVVGSKESLSTTCLQLWMHTWVMTYLPAGSARSLLQILTLSCRVDNINALNDRCMNIVGASRGCHS